MNETEQVIDGLDEVEIANTSIDEIDSENINLIFVGIDKSGSMGMYERDMVKALSDFKDALINSGITRGNRRAYTYHDAQRKRCKNCSK